MKRDMTNQLWRNQMKGMKGCFRTKRYGTAGVELQRFSAVLRVHQYINWGPGRFSSSFLLYD